MWLPWVRTKKPKGDSEAALRDAEQNLSKVKKQGEEVSSIVDTLREFRERNHFAEQLEDMIIRRRGQTR